MAIHYYTEACTLKFGNRRKVNRWIQETIRAEGRKSGQISIIFCSDDYLLQLNRQHLNHDYYTDIITFDYGQENGLCGDLFISVDTVRHNAEQYGVSLLDELHRVIIHGILHLCGYPDKTPEQARRMRAKEDFYLNLLRL
ncbi:MAG: rRNA maturation RNase YbeY [Rikenellaceae bacterium]|nr:rRNA maturation RNase YbeY [Rikenellaceae bacterium]